MAASMAIDTGQTTIALAIQKLVARGALFVVNHSGGKDSQAMFLYLFGLVPKEQLLTIHAELAEVDWPDIPAHIVETTYGVPLTLCRAPRTFFEIVERRQMFPSPRMRWCTSDLKRGGIEKAIRATGAKLIVSCDGRRAQESPNRSRIEPFSLSERNSKAGREWYEWLPIHDWTIEQVFERIASAGQNPHWAYAAGMGRLSCSFCVMSSAADLRTAAQLRPDLYKKYVATEKAIGQVMMMPTKSKGRLTLEQITGIPAGDMAVAAQDIFA